MPLDCKQGKIAPVYDWKSFGYRNRRDIECLPEHIRLVWNGSDVTRPSPQMGIMGLESRNKILNQFHFRIGQQKLATAILNSSLFVIHNHWITLNYWKEQHAKPEKERAQPEYHTWIEKFPQEFKELEDTLNDMFQFSSKLRNNFNKRKDKKHRLLTVIDVDETALNNMACDMIEKNALQFNKKDLKWNSRHLLSMFAYITKKGWTLITEQCVEELYEYFEEQIDKDTIWKHCKRWRGIQWSKKA